MSLGKEQMVSLSAKATIEHKAPLEVGFFINEEA